MQARFVVNHISFRPANVTSEISRISCYGGPELGAPVVGSELLIGPQVSFLKFILGVDFEAYRLALFADDHTSVATALRDFRKATEFHYFGHRTARSGQAPPNNPGLLDERKAESKKALKAFTQLAYRGDPERRGPLFWKRVAGLLWDAYEALMALRRKAEKIRQQEVTRIECRAKRREARAAYMRCYRAKSRE